MTKRDKGQKGTFSALFFNSFVQASNCWKCSVFAFWLNQLVCKDVQLCSRTSGDELPVTSHGNQLPWLTSVNLRRNDILFSNFHQCGFSFHSLWALLMQDAALCCWLWAMPFGGQSKAMVHAQLEWERALGMAQALAQAVKSSCVRRVGTRGS